jgi:mevalonate kinase
MKVGMASGKIILFGEHGVVYGGEAVVVSLPGMMKARVDSTSGDRNSVILNQRVLPNDDSLVVGLCAMLEAAGLGASSYSIELSSSIPAGMGMGFSAACAVAVARASQNDSRIERVLELAEVSEKVVHGRSSGIDSFAAASEGLFRYRRAWEQAPSEREVLGTSTSLPLRIRSSGIIGSTLQMCNKVANMDMKSRSGLLEEMERCVSSGLKGLRCRRLDLVGQAMNWNHAVLQRLGVSTAALDKLVDQMRSSGALGAKLSGSGGGGVVVGLVAD